MKSKKINHKKIEIKTKSKSIISKTIQKCYISVKDYGFVNEEVERY